MLTRRRKLKLHTYLILMEFRLAAYYDAHIPYYLKVTWKLPGKIVLCKYVN